MFLLFVFHLNFTLSPQGSVWALSGLCLGAVWALSGRCRLLLPVSNRYNHHLAPVAPPLWLFGPRGGVLQWLHPSGGVCRHRGMPPLCDEGGAPGRLTSEIQFCSIFHFYDFSFFKFTCVSNLVGPPRRGYPIRTQHVRYFHNAHAHFR